LAPGGASLIRKKMVGTQEPFKIQVNQKLKKGHGNGPSRADFATDRPSSTASLIEPIEKPGGGKER